MKFRPAPSLPLVAALTLSILALAGPARAQSVPPPPPPPTAPSGPLVLSPLDQLLGPIALYPDPLVALILPASTDPIDLNGAANFLSEGGDPSLINGQPWDASVKSLAHYPAVVEWMSQNPDWTQALGAAFAANPGDVMASIQHLRSIALAAGTLTDNSQQVIVMEGDNIAIEPAQSEVIYVPSYDPGVVYVDQPYYGYNGPFLTFGAGFPVGVWLGYNFDWRRRAVFVGDWRNWHNSQGWGHPVFPGQHGFINGSGAHRWNPSNSRPRASGDNHPPSFGANRPEARPPSFAAQPHRESIARPRPMRGMPAPPRPAYRPAPRQNAAPARKSEPQRRDDKPHN
jgi:hypothetical protein